MGIGHVAVGFAAKRAIPTAPLAVFVLAAGFSAVRWGAAILTGLEHGAIDPSLHIAMPLRLDYFPWTHSLVLSLMWSTLFGPLPPSVVPIAAMDIVTGVIAIVLGRWLDQQRRGAPAPAAAPA